MKTPAQIMWQTLWCMWITFIYICTIDPSVPNAPKFIGLFWAMHGIRVVHAIWGWSIERRYSK